MAEALEAGAFPAEIGCNSSIMIKGRPKKSMISFKESMILFDLVGYSSFSPSVVRLARDRVMRKLELAHIRGSSNGVNKPIYESGLGRREVGVGLYHSYSGRVELRSMFCDNRDSVRQPASLNSDLVEPPRIIVRGSDSEAGSASGSL